MKTRTKWAVNVLSYAAAAMFIAAAWTAVPTESDEARAYRITQAYRMHELVRLAHLEVALARLETMGEGR